ncbi:MAG: DUF2214 family protein [Rhodocyclaceae bacterium]
MPTLLAVLHYLAIGALVFVLGVEWALLRGRIDGARVALLSRADFFYMLAAIAVLATGLARLFLGEKPVLYYMHAGFFHTKVLLFIVVGLISIMPIIRFARWRRRFPENGAAEVDITERDGARRWLRIELILLPLIPVCAVFMARGWPW